MGQWEKALSPMTRVQHGPRMEDKVADADAGAGADIDVGSLAHTVESFRCYFFLTEYEEAV